MAPWFGRRKRGNEPPSLIRHRTPDQKAAAARQLEATGGAHMVTGGKVLPVGEEQQPAPQKHPPKEDVLEDHSTAVERQQRMAKVQHANLPDPIMDRATREEFNRAHNIVARLMRGPEERFWLNRHKKPYRRGHAPSVYAHNMITAAHAEDPKLVKEYAESAVTAYKGEAALENRNADMKQAAGEKPELVQDHRTAATRNKQYAHAYELLAKNPDLAINAMKALRQAAKKK